LEFVEVELLLLPVQVVAALVDELAVEEELLVVLAVEERVVVQY
jgi:hypothetical protein